MTKRRIEIEVDIPEGYEATGEFRVPCWKEGEYFLAASGSGALGKDADRGTDGSRCQDPRIILRKTWTWPEWLTAPWIAMDKNGEWNAHSEEPGILLCADEWGCDKGTYARLDTRLIESWTPPPCDDWTQSLRKNPNLADQPNSSGETT